MTIMEQWSQKIPAYYNTMYLDGFTPTEILWAKRWAMWEEYDKRQEKKQEKAEQAMIEASI